MAAYVLAVTLFFTLADLAAEPLCGRGIPQTAEGPSWLAPLFFVFFCVGPAIHDGLTAALARFGLAPPYRGLTWTSRDGREVASERMKWLLLYPAFTVIGGFVLLVAWLRDHGCQG